LVANLDSHAGLGQHTKCMLLAWMCFQMAVAMASDMTMVPPLTTPGSKPRRCTRWQNRGAAGAGAGGCRTCLCISIMQVMCFVLTVYKVTRWIAARPAACSRSLLKAAFPPDNSPLHPPYSRQASQNASEGAQSLPACAADGPVPGVAQPVHGSRSSRDLVQANNHDGAMGSTRWQSRPLRQRQRRLTTGAQQQPRGECVRIPAPCCQPRCSMRIRHHPKLPVTTGPVCACRHSVI
jgi:hypothetical protein